MTCPLPVRKWWQDYVAGRLKTPRDIFLAAWNNDPDPAQPYDRFLDVPDPVGWDAPARLKAPLHFRSESYMRQVRVADWSDCDPRLVVWAAVFQQMARKRDIPLYVHTALRSRSVQDRLRAEGRSRATYPRSAHNIGEAVDVVHGVYHWDMNAQEWRLLHALGLLALDRVNTYLRKDHKLSLTWGGTFRSLYDPAHWEITDFRSRIRELPEPDAPVRYTPDQAIKKRHDLLSGMSV